MTLVKEECSLCGRILSYRSLWRCYQCNRLYCRGCITFSEDGNVLCLNCARRIVSPRKLGTKYSPLSRYLARRSPFIDRVTLTFAKIEGIIGDNLPFSALRYKHWWTNTPGRVEAKAWLSVGWTIHDVNISDRIVTFKKATSLETKTRKKCGKPTSPSIRRSFRPAKPQILRRPSKTRMARAQARLKNVERKKTSTRLYRGELKPEPPHEKRLYKPEAKP